MKPSKSSRKRLKKADERHGGRTRIRVLLADDDVMIRHYVCRELGKQHGIEVVCQAGVGKETVEQAKKCKPDVVVLDVPMSGMDGLEAARRIQQRRFWRCPGRAEPRGYEA